MNSSVSILVPTYNRSKYIEECVESVLEQSFKNFKLIIYDDGSTDNTLNILNQIKDKRIQIIKGGMNKGVGYARNFLLQRVDTLYACWQDSDDAMHPCRLEEQKKELEKGQLDIVFCQIRKFKGDHIQLFSGGEITRIAIGKYLKFDKKATKNNSACATAFFRSELKAFEINESLSLGGEDRLWVQKLLAAKKRFGYVNKPLYICRMHGDRIGTNKNKVENKKLKYLEDGIIASELKDIGVL